MEESPGLSKRQLIAILQELKVLEGDPSTAPDAVASDQLPFHAGAAATASAAAESVSFSSSSGFQPLAKWTEMDLGKFVEMLGRDRWYSRAAHAIRNFGLDGLTLQVT